MPCAICGLRSVRDLAQIPLMLHLTFDGCYMCLGIYLAKDLTSAHEIAPYRIEQISKYEKNDETEAVINYIKSHYEDV